MHIQQIFFFGQISCATFKYNARREQKKKTPTRFSNRESSKKRKKIMSEGVRSESGKKRTAAVVVVMPLQQQTTTKKVARRDTGNKTGNQNEVHKVAKAYLASLQYPHHDVWRMFSGNGCTGREYGFFVMSQSHEQIMHRHLRFTCPEKFKEAIQQRSPFRVEGGGIHAFSNSSAKNDVIARELTYDVDIDAYDKPPRARGCACTEVAYCPACWPIINTAARVIHTRICQVYRLAPECVRVFYSGRRGIHVRVFGAPKASMLWSPCKTIRTIVNNAVLDTANKQPHSAMDLVVPAFVDWYIANHQRPALAALTSACSKIAISLSGGASDRMRAELRVFANIVTSHNCNDSPRLVIAAARAAIKSYPDSHSQNWSLSVAAVVADAARSCLWPRIDGEPTTQSSHLLRLPMSIHTSSGRLCVPIQHWEFEEFYPDTHAPLASLADDGVTVVFSPESAAVSAFSVFHDWAHYTYNSSP